MLELVDDAEEAGARLAKACEILGLSARTVQRWRQAPEAGDQRRGPCSEPANKLSEHERRKVLETLHEPRFRDLPPEQLVAALADEDTYLCSPSTMYRYLRMEGEMTHRDSTRPAVHRRPREFVATGPQQVVSWDITYLRSPVRGVYYYLYLFTDVWSRKCLGGEIHRNECPELAARIFERICEKEGLDPEGMVLHSDNGNPMKGSTMLATLQRLGVVASFSRPRVSDDNPFSESLFRTMKYRPEYPYSGAFESLEDARQWVEIFIRWYNHEHRHSEIGFVTPAERHDGRDRAILRNRRRVYEEARRRHPERWSGPARKWKRPETVTLNPEKKKNSDQHQDRERAAA